MKTMQEKGESRLNMNRQHDGKWENGKILLRSPRKYSIVKLYLKISKGGERI